MLNFNLLLELLVELKKIWRSKRSTFVVQNLTTYKIPLQKRFSVVDIKTRKRSCLLNETLDNLLRGAFKILCLSSKKFAANESFDILNCIFE